MVRKSDDSSAQELYIYHLYSFCNQWQPQGFGNRGRGRGRGGGGGGGGGTQA